MPPAPYTTSRPKSRRACPDRGQTRHSSCRDGTGLDNETRFDARTIRLLEPEARQARSAGPFRYRSGGYPSCSRRHFHACGGFRRRHQFRLAGTRVCALFAREIKGEAFNALWSEASREHVEELLAAVIDENVGTVAGIIGRTEVATKWNWRLLLLPLAHAGHARVRALGVLAPLSPRIGWANGRLLSLN